MRSKPFSMLAAHSIFHSWARCQKADARNWLMSINGVGPKTASCVLLFGLGMPVMPG